MKKKQLAVFITSNLDSAILFKLFDGSQPKLPFSSQYQYKWDITDEDFSVTKGLTLNYRLIGGSTYSQYSTNFLNGSTAIVASLNASGYGYFGLVVQAGRTYIIGYSDLFEFGNFKLDDIISYQLTNFLGNPTPNVGAYGLFHTDETFIGLAADNVAAAALYNADATLNTIAQAFPDPSSNSSLFLRILNEGVSLPDVKALRYWQVDNEGGWTPTVAISNGSYHQNPDGTVAKTDTYTLGTYNMFGMNTNAVGTGENILSVDNTSPYRDVPFPNGINRIYHNEDGEWLFMNVFGTWLNIQGYLPPTVRFVAVQSNGLDNIGHKITLDQFANFNEAAINIEYLGFNGGSVQLPAKYTAVCRSLKSLWFLVQWTLLDSPFTWTQFGVNSTDNPDLTMLLCRGNNGNVLSLTNAEIDSIPPMIRGLDFVGANLQDSDTVDRLLIRIAANWVGAVPVATAKIAISQNPARTAASDAAVATLTAQGFGIA